MVRLESGVVINRPIDEVWAFLWDPFNIPRVGVMTLGARLTPGQPGPPRLGTTFQGRIVIFGFETRLNAEVTELDPPHAFAFSGGGMGMRSLSFRATFEATAEGTKVVRVGELEPRWIMKLLWPILGPYMRRQMDVSSQNIKRLLEAGRG